MASSPGGMMRPGLLSIASPPALNLSISAGGVLLFLGAGSFDDSLWRSADQMKPELVRRNKSVTLIYRMPRVSLTGRGKAIEIGAEGEQITARKE